MNRIALYCLLETFAALWMPTKSKMKRHGSDIYLDKAVLTFDELQPDNVVLLEQNVLAAVELHLVLVTLVVETVETRLPQSWNWLIHEGVAYEINRNLSSKILTQYLLWIDIYAVLSCVIYKSISKTNGKLVTQCRLTACSSCEFPALYEQVLIISISNNMDFCTPWNIFDSFGYSHN